MPKMQALQPHTYHGTAYAPGATYDADDGDVNTIEVQGKGARVDASQPAAKRGTAVEPMALKPGKATPGKAKAAKKPSR